MIPAVVWLVLALVAWRAVSLTLPAAILILSVLWFVIFLPTEIYGDYLSAGRASTPVALSALLSLPSLRALPRPHPAAVRAGLLLLSPVWLAASLLASGNTFAVGTQRAVARKRRLRRASPPRFRNGRARVESQSMTSSLRAVYRVWTSILFLAILVQIGAAGYGAFYADKKVSSGRDLLTKNQFDHGFNFHDGFGYVIFLGTVVLLFLFALSARLGRKRVLLALSVPLLIVLQIALAIIGEKTPAVGVLHPVNAFVIAGFTGMLTHRAWRADAGPAGTSAAA